MPLVVQPDSAAPTLPVVRMPGMLLLRGALVTTSAADAAVPAHPLGACSVTAAARSRSAKSAATA